MDNADILEGIDRLRRLLHGLGHCRAPRRAKRPAADEEAGPAE